MQRLSLDGAWRLMPVDSFRQGFYALDDDAWLEQSLPAHWQQHPLLERYTGRMVYRRRFALPADQDMRSALLETPGARCWLRLNGAFYWSQPYFNGVDLGRHEGYFIPQEHDVTPWIADQNTLVVEVACPEERDKFGKRLITGVFSHWDCLDPATNPGGIWLPVELLVTGPTRIKEVLLHTETVSEASATLRYSAVLDAATAGEALLRWTFAPKNFAGEVQVIEQRRNVEQGAHELTGDLRVRDPQLWWTHDLGRPNCYTVTLTVLQAGAASDEQTWTFGIRRFELRDWIAYLNGVRLFIKGNNYAPGDTRIATMTPARYAEDLQLAQACHMNMLRVHAHIEHPAFYGCADEAGVLLWQDFPLQWMYRREVLPEARRQARLMVRQLYNHPAVVIWCMHNEPLHVENTADERFSRRVHSWISGIMPNWNRDVMDAQIKRIVEEEDRTRPAIRSSGEFAIPMLRAGSDSHFYMGWYTRDHGPLRFWEPLARYFPKIIRFVTEFGAQSFPNIESCLKFMDEDVTKIDWHYMAHRHHFQPNIMDHSLDWRSVRALADLVRLTQDYQIAINRFYVDRLRYYKYRPTGGIVPFMFHDPNPAISFSIIDYWRVPKRSYDALRLAFSPQYTFTLLDQDHHFVGAALNLPIYVVNDAHYDMRVELRASITDPGDIVLANMTRTLTLPPDSPAIMVDQLRLTPEFPGMYRLWLTLECDGVAIENEYSMVVGERAAEPQGRKKAQRLKSLVRLGS